MKRIMCNGADVGRWARSKLTPAMAGTVVGIGNVIAGEPEIRLLYNLCVPNMVSVDVGANFGAYAYWLRKFSSKCIAFEPNPKCAEFLRKAFHDIRVEEVALSNASGDAELVVPRQGLTDIEAGGKVTSSDWETGTLEAGHIGVITRTLDDYKLDSVGIMKIDTEGHELSVLEGASATIANALPRLIIECEERHRKDALASVIWFLKPLGYKVLCLSRPRRYEIVHDSVAGYSRNSSNNFLFIHEDDPLLNNIKFPRAKCLFSIASLRS